MKLLRELVRIFSVITICFCIDRSAFMIYSLLFLCAIYIYPIFISFIARILGIRKSTIGYTGCITIRKPSENDNGAINFKMYVEPDQLYFKDEALFIVKRETK